MGHLKYPFSISSIKNIRMSVHGFKVFLNICSSALDNFAPRKKKFSRGHYPFLWIKLWSPNEKNMFEKFVKFVTKTNLSKRKLLVIGNTFTAYFFYKRKTNVGKLLRPVLFDNIKPSSNIIWVEGGEINQQSWQKCDCFQNNFFFDAIENLKKSEWAGMTHELMFRTQVWKQFSNIENILLKMLLKNTKTGEKFNFLKVPKCYDRNLELKESHPEQWCACQYFKLLTFLEPISVTFLTNVYVQVNTHLC